MPVTFVTDLGCGCPPVTLTINVTRTPAGAVVFDQHQLDLACLAHHLGTHPDEP